MELFGGVITISNISTLLVVVFAVLFLGYLLGRITIKGISLGDAGVFIVALICGALCFKMNAAGELVFFASAKVYDFSAGLSLIESLGLILFVTSVGYIAGPKFFRTFNRKSLAYIVMGVAVIAVGALTAIVLVLIDSNLSPDMAVGLLTGGLTSTPGLSAAKEVATDADAVLPDEEGYTIDEELTLSPFFQTPV